MFTTVQAGELGGCNRLNSNGVVRHSLSLDAVFRRECKGYILEMYIAPSNIPWLYSRRVTRTEAKVWRVKIVPMHMVANTGRAAGLVAYRKVHRVEGGK